MAAKPAGRNEAGSTDAGDRFPLHALREYALQADGERGAVVGPLERR